MTLIDRIEADVKTLIDEPFPSDDVAVDLAGRVNKLSAQLAGYKRSLLSEIQGPIRGSAYQLATSKKANRSYNTAAILYDFDFQGWTLPELVRADAVRLSWQWTNLKAAMHEAGVTMRLAPREIEDDGAIDGPHIGEHWVEDSRLEGLAF